MNDSQSFLNLRGFLTESRRRKTKRGRTLSSRFRLEPLEARVLLSGDLGGSMSVMELLNSPNFGVKQVVVQNVPPVQSAAQTSSGGTINVGQATRDSGNAFWVTQDFGISPDNSAAPTASQLHVYENGRELGAAHSVHRDIQTLGGGRFSHWQGSDGVVGLYLSSSDNSNPATNGRSYTYTVGEGTQLLPISTPSQPSQTPAAISSSIPSTGRLFYISPGGSDASDGSASAPWHSIHAAAQRLQPGDTAILMDGVYEEGSIRFGTSGTADNPITLKAQNKWGAVLSSTSSTDPALSIHASYITIEDLRISVSPNNAGGGLSSMNGAIRAWESTSPTTSNPSTGYVGFTARGVLVDASGQRSVGIKTNQDFSLVENCEIHSSLEAFNNTDTVFRNNTIYGGDAWGDSIYGKGGVRNLQLYNNTVHMQDPNGRGLFLGGNSGTSYVYDPSTGYEAYNSIAYDNTIINETGNGRAMTLGLVGTMTSTLQNNVLINGGQVFQTVGGPYHGSPAPMPANSNLSNNRFA